MGNIAIYQREKVNLPCPYCGFLIRVGFEEEIKECPKCGSRLDLF